MNREEARKKATELVNQMTLEEKQASCVMTLRRSSDWASRLTTGGTKLSTESHAPARQLFSHKQSALELLLTQSF